MGVLTNAAPLLQPGFPGHICATPDEAVRLQNAQPVFARGGFAIQLMMSIAGRTHSIPVKKK